MFRFPKPTERTVILGATGSGKSVFGLWELAHANWDQMPWVIIDYKGDDLLEEILLDNGWHEKRVGKSTVIERGYSSKIKAITPYDKAPTKPGLYYMRPDAKIDDLAVREFLLKVYRQGRCGLFIDEGFAIPNKGELDMIFTQGRSKRIPVIVLYQRPVYMTRFAIAQASFFAHFDENDERDLDTVEQFMKPAIAPDGTKITARTELPPHWCLWFDVAKRKSTVLSACPPPEAILSQFRNRLQPAKNRENDECSAVTLC